MLFLRETSNRRGTGAQGKLKMKSCLVFLTKKYPFDSGEEFIENEMPFLAKSFDRVILIATSVSDRPVQTRQVPGNVEVHFLGASGVRRAVLPAAALGALRPLPKCAEGTDRAEATRSLKRRLFFSYFLTKSEQVRKGCARILRDVNLDECRVTFYSYWLYDTAVAAVGLKSEFAPDGLAVSRAHRYDLYEDQNPAGFLPMRPFLLRNLDAVYPCSRDGSEALTRRCPEFGGKVHTAYLGTADRGLSPKREGGAFHLVSCCHLSPVKRVDLLARSLAQLKESGLALRWTHFGGGDGLEELRAYARESLPFLDCRFEGEVGNGRLMEFYRSTPVDCFVNTSSSEGLPVSIMEAASFGIPVVATDVGGTSEIVRNGENGFLLPRDFAPDELAGIIERLCRMPEAERGALGVRSRRIWEENFCSEKNYARFAGEIAPK